MIKNAPRLSAATLALAAALLAGCGTTKLPEQAPMAAATPAPVVTAPAPTTATPASPAGTAQSGVTSVDLAAGSRTGAGAAAGGAALLALPSQRVVYFDFDSFLIKDEFKTLLDSYARVLAAKGDQQLVIEGHADERGSREYNLALGQKRAGSVLNALKLLGAKESQMEAVSFGEERPAATGSDEAAWAKNRRAELRGR